ncbi:MAG: DUF937 domain-containing protein [Gemmatimonadota bacterium]|nr:DUF937 domain-containing protein [Gemmatimonadota bacterium]
MASVLETLVGQFAGTPVQRLSQSLGTDDATAQKALGAALPLLVSALAKNASEPKGADALHRALAKDHDGSVLNDVGGFLNQPDTKTGDGILRHVLGDRRQAAEAGISQASGLDARGAATLLATLAPVVMGALGRQQRQQGLDTAALAQMLQGERQQAANAPGLSGLAGLLDADKDGQIVDDLAKLGGKMLGGLFGKRSG